MSLKFGIILLIIGIPIIVLILAVFMVYGGENGYNRYCDKSNNCASTVRCRAKSEDECKCFKPKKRRKNRFLE